MVNKFFFSFVLLLHLCSLVSAQHGVRARLYENGFENVMLNESNDTLEVYFEHRTFRNPYQSMVFANKIIGDVGGKAIFFIPAYHNQPIGKFSGNDFGFHDLSKENTLFFNENNEINKGYRFHVRISPDFSARFGKFDDPFQNKTNLILDTRIYLFSGVSLHTGVLLPITNNLDAQEKNIRLAPSHLHLFRAVENRHFYSITGGLFFFDRYGLDFQYRYMPMDKNWSLGVESSLTGFYFLPKSGVYMNRLDEFTFLLNYEYRLPRLPSISLGLTAGQFLFNDKGLRGDLIKQYGNIDIGLYGAMTENGLNVGFQFAFPLFPGKILRNRNFELRSTEEFRWEYGYNNVDIVARKFRLGTPRLQDVLRQYHPKFIRSQRL
ncbi:YjbH domain-containing protein [Mongoliibacter ruber]|uniref:Exopolysaccharide biosynthesis protein YbjH n=1 Tax=Mongoliibacter ruber TaxID=1750599 RepID=A0A2T0WPC8_9BACT|nr:YjbH domain-containing protein [Mongoliibacter ruber]PRY88561.1 exopolysaccharide biosynthesis protein YbjH [Mongoliibacter ruber]